MMRSMLLNACCGVALGRWLIFDEVERSKELPDLKCPVGGISTRPKNLEVFDKLS